VGRPSEPQVKATIIAPKDNQLELRWTRAAPGHFNKVVGYKLFYKIGGKGVLAKPNDLSTKQKEIDGDNDTYLLDLTAEKLEDCRGKELSIAIRAIGETDK
jgi:hypothetical protein